MKSYFETADVPTQAQFAAVIDAMYDMAQEATDTAQQAVDDLAAALALRPDYFPVLAMCKFTRTATPNGNTFAPTANTNASASVLNVDSSGLLRITFDVALADTNYKIEAYQKVAGVVTQLGFTPSTRTTALVEFNVGIVSVPRDYFIIIRQEW